jgi:carbamoyl-phosphate synthase small subunit
MGEASPAILVLEDGTVFHGRSVGAPGERAFELVFNTALTGYQEILTDPSYCRQGVLMTYPQIGNYGICLQDDESARCWTEAFIMHQLSPAASNWRSDMPLGQYLKERDVLAIEGVDTREITLKLRQKGALRAVLSTECFDADALLAIALAHPSLEGQNLVDQVTCKEKYSWTEAADDAPSLADDAPRLPLVCLDFGVKRNILRCLVSAGFDLTVVPAHTTAEEILALNPAGVFLSNGPGDPAALASIHAQVTKLVEANVPIFGICLGHQILAHVFGAQTFKMRFGHHGANHPVIESATGRIDIASHNHGFAVDPDSLEKFGLVLTHQNANDGTVAGMRHKDKPIFSVQYHPEAAPGPHDPFHLFGRFREIILAAKECVV